MPLSVIVAAVFLVGICLISVSRHRAVAGLLGSRTLACCLLGVLAVLIGIEGTWTVDLHRSWPFLAVMFVTMASLGVVTVTSFRKCSLSFTLCHLGIFVILFGGFFGAADFTVGQLPVRTDVPSHIAVSHEGMQVLLPFEITLKDFSIEYYEDGTSPKQYVSVLDIDGREFVTSVNHPCRVRGYRICQYDYGRTEKGMYSVVEVVRDPWIGVVFAGMILLVVSALMELRDKWQRKGIVAILVLAPVFAAISVAKINFGTLMPALRSFWFIPHLIIYMLAYSVMAVSLITGIAGLFTEKIKPELPRKLLATSSSLLVLGMVCGAIWAKNSWGDYWTWDAKENWAAVTWILTLVGTHLPPKVRRGGIVIAITVAFIAMQITWYGVQYLPASWNSLHIYGN